MLPRMRLLSVTKTNEFIKAEMFISTFDLSGGLNTLVVRGIKHKETLENLRVSLVKSSRDFVIKNSSK